MSSPTLPDPSPPAVGAADARCAKCGAPLAVDQRYCLSCGQRLSEPRVDFRRALGLEPPPPPPPARITSWDQRAPWLGLACVAAVLLALGVGIVIGRGDRPQAAALKPDVVMLRAPAATSPAPAAATTPTALAGAVPITDTWGAGASGWTVELSSLPKSGASTAAVDAAESAARAKGASAVGVLDGDNHSGTPTGAYVVYSGHFATRAQAAAAQKKLVKSFPGALVLHVTPSGSSTASTAPTAGASQATNLRHLSGAAYSKASAKLPSTIGTGGAPPPKDNKAPGGGSGAGTCIGC